MKPSRSLPFLTLSLLLAGCSSVLRQAPVVEASTPAVTTPPPVVAEEPPAKADPKGFYTVKKGDTLIRIALDHGLNYRELAAWNNLADPDDIKADQLIRIEAPPHPVVTTAPVALPHTDTAPAVPRKSGPRTDKKPYSDSALADLQKAEGREAHVEPAAAPAVATIAPGPNGTASDDEKLSWMWPADGKVVATFDEGKNKGIDIAGRLGQQVVAAGAGKVMYAGAGIRGYGNLVIVKHSNSLLTAYAHNKAILVKEGEKVNKGQVIAEMGDSDADAVKLHFEIRQQGKPVDPARFLPGR